MARAPPPQRRLLVAASALALAAALAAASAAAAPPPNFVLIVADDLGYADVGCMGASDVRTPRIDALHARGRRLEHYYGQPVCSPSRAALHTGRLPLAYGLQTYVIDPTGVDYGLDLNETTLPQLLRDRAGYATHAVGKYHLGMARWEQTPTFRGYDSFHGFYTGGEDYFTHRADSNGLDMHVDVGRECGANCSVVDWATVGEYSTHLFTRAAVDVIRAHPPATPLFLYLAYQAVHSPDQVPQSYIDPYNATISDPKRRTFAGMLSCLDEGVGNVTDALREAGLEDNTLVIFVADNGGPIRCVDGPCGDATGTSNWPLRGGKHTVWEGGVRLTALAAGPMVAGPHGTNLSGLVHHADVLPTLLEAAGVSYAPAPGFELHGASQWPLLTRAGAPSSRGEVVVNIDPLQPAVGSSIPPGSGNAALITSDGSRGMLKLHLGLSGPPDSWSPPNASVAVSALGPDGTEAAEAAAAAGRLAASVNCSAAFSEGVCLPGFSLPGHASPTVVADAAACCALCAGTAGCALWTLNNVTGKRECFLKTSGAVPVAGATCVSSPGEAPKPFRVWPLNNMTAQLFNLTADPFERDDISAQHPDIVATMTARLAVWGAAARDPYYRTATVDPRSDPALRNNSWTPWL
jgi:arylsulfatase A-like enzyme